MENNLKSLYFQFLKFHEKNFLNDRKLWFGVKDLKIKEKKIKEIFLNYEKESFFEFCKRIKDIVFAKEPIKETLEKWSVDNWTPYYFLKFLKNKKIIDFKKNGKIILIKKEFKKIFPPPQTEKEIKEKIEKKIKTKLILKAPSNYIFKTKIKAKYDQFPISVSSAIFISSKILEYLPLYKKFLFVGDDDLMSVYLSLTDVNFRAKVVDIDENLLNNIKEISKKFNLKIETEKINIFKTKKLKEDFIGFLTSPVYTFEGTKAFLNFGINQLGQDGGYVFLNLSDEAIGNRYLFLEEFFAKKNLKIEEVIKGKIYYPWQIIHPDEKIILKKYQKLFSKKIVENSPIISSSFWIFNFIPFKVPKPQKQPFYTYL